MSKFEMKLNDIQQKCNIKNLVTGVNLGCYLSSYALNREILKDYEKAF